MVSALDRKLLRDISQLGGQIITICLVVAAGISGFIAMQTAYRSLLSSRDSYYEAYRFGDVFASSRRTPQRVAEQLAALPGVALIHTRVVESVRLPLEDGAAAASGSIVSLPDAGPAPLNAVCLRDGRMPDPSRSDEALLLESFASANGIQTGDRIPVVINRKLRQILITGLAMSPEYVLAMGSDVFSFKPGSFAVIWMRHSVVAPAFDMAGAFNNVVFRLEPGASEADALAGIDRTLSAYGGYGAYGRDRHVSDHFVTSELDGLKVTVTLIPLIFLSVAAFLVNVVLGRLVELQRGQIATLKAVGYSDLAVGVHYLKLVSCIVLIGSALGLGGGALLSGPLLGAYEPYFHFPSLKPDFDASVVGVAVAVSLLAACAGAFLSVRKIVVLPPAEAMRPPAPPLYQRSFIDRWSEVVVGPIGRMVLREMRRRPVRLLVSVGGIALAVAIMIIGRFASDSMQGLMETQFERAMAEDLTVGLRHPMPAGVEGTMLALPGVRYVEATRSVPVRLRVGSASRDTVIEGRPDGGRLRLLLNRDGQRVTLPMDGLVLTDILAEKLRVGPGDYVELELLEGSRRTVRARLAATVSDMLGMQGYMRRSALEALLREPPTVGTLLLSVDADQTAEVQRRLYEMPNVAGVSSPRSAMVNFRETQGGTMLAMSLVLALFAAIIAIGIVYNNARVTLSMRRRDLASMRVLGFTQREISTVLLGELAIQVLLALPPGMWLGTVASGALLATDPENYRMPAVISGATYAYAAVVTSAAALLSGWMVRRKLGQLDLIAVLKTRE